MGVEPAGTVPDEAVEAEPWARADADPLGDMIAVFDEGIRGERADPQAGESS